MNRRVLLSGTSVLAVAVLVIQRRPIYKAYDIRNDAYMPVSSERVAVGVATGKITVTWNENSQAYHCERVGLGHA